MSRTVTLFFADGAHCTLTLPDNHPLCQFHTWHVYASSTPAPAPTKPEPDLAAVVEDIRAELWTEPVDPTDAEKGTRTNPDKEWSPDTIEAVAHILRSAGLGPKED